MQAKKDAAQDVSPVASAEIQVEKKQNGQSKPGAKIAERHFQDFQNNEKTIPEPLVVRAEANHHHQQQQQQQQQRSVVFDLSPSGGEKEAATNDKSKVEYYKFRYGPKRSPCKCALVT